MRNPFRCFNSSPEVIRLTVLMYVRYPLSRRCQSKIEYSARLIDSIFAAIDFPRFFGSDPGGSTAISGIQNFALTMPVDVNFRLGC